MPPTPLILISDSVLGKTGLGRITRELAERIHANLSDSFRVACIGYGGTTTSRSPFPIYPVSFSLESGYVMHQLPAIYQDFCGKQDGILFPIMNHGWLNWLACPDILEPGPLKDFCMSPIRRWSYLPIDAEGPTGPLLPVEKKILSGLGRIAAYTTFGAKVIERTMEPIPIKIPVLPHGTDSWTFYPRSRSEARKLWFGPTILKKEYASIPEDVLLLGCIATNTPRKDWPLAFQSCSELVKTGHNAGLWIHTDRPLAHWDLFGMAEAYGIENRVLITTSNLSDEELAWGIAACNVILGVAPEGWGLPLSEALACGVPVVTGRYAGATEFVPREMMVDPVMFRVDGPYASRRPVYLYKDWAAKILEVSQFETTDNTGFLDPSYTWKGCWTKWADHLKDGL